MTQKNDCDRAALSNLVATSHMWLFKLKFKLIHIHHFSGVQKPGVASGCHIGEHRYKTFPLLWQVQLDNSVTE